MLYIYYSKNSKEAGEIRPPIDAEREQVQSVVRCDIEADDGRVSSITFKNGITHRFQYKV